MAINFKKASKKRSIKGMTEEKALESAKAKLNTFEGNLKAEHTETHFVYKKIRG